MSDWERVEADLLTLYRAASGIDGWSKDLVGELIYVGEYYLALDIMSYAYLNNGIDVPDDLFEIYERLAVEMDMEKDPEFEGAAQLRAETKARLGSGAPDLARAIVPGGSAIAEQSLTEDKEDAPPAEAAKPRFAISDGPMSWTGTEKVAVMGRAGARLGGAGSRPIGPTSKRSIPLCTLRTTRHPIGAWVVKAE